MFLRMSMIFHSPSAAEAGSISTQKEQTLVQAYLTPVKAEKENERTTYLFPDNAIIFNSQENKLLSKWSVLQTSILHQSMDRFLMERQRRGFRMFKKEQNSFEMGIKLNVLINLMNKVYGLHNWFTEIGDSKIIEMTEKENLVEKLVIETHVILILADTSKVIKSGMGYSYGLNKEMSFKKCKKESVSEAMKLCISELILLLIDYEEKVRVGYYEKYK